MLYEVCLLQFFLICAVFDACNEYMNTPFNFDSNQNDVLHTIYMKILTKLYVQNSILCMQVNITQLNYGGGKLAPHQIFSQRFLNITIYIMYDIMYNV